jgi:hypothetical protein
MASIQQFRDNLLDTDIALDDADRAVAAALEAQERARQERHRVARHLQYLIDLHDECAALAETFGPEIAAQCVSTPGEFSEMEFFG